MTWKSSPDLKKSMKVLKGAVSSRNTDIEIFNLLFHLLFQTKIMLTFAQAAPLEPQILRGSKTNMACYWKNSKYLQTKLGLTISSGDFEILNKGGGVVKTLRKSRFAEK